jgi:hypothetical protein
VFGSLFGKSHLPVWALNKKLGIWLAKLEDTDGIGLDENGLESVGALLVTCGDDNFEVLIHFLCLPPGGLSIQTIRSIPLFCV